VQRDTNGLTAENSELKLRLQTMEQQVHLQDGKHLSCESLLRVVPQFQCSLSLSLSLSPHAPCLCVCGKIIIVMF
jgi:hypothetical protein